MSNVLIIILIVYSIIVLVTLRNALLQVSNPAKTLSWILVIIFMPIIGLLLFKVLGRSVKRDRFFIAKQPFYNDHIDDLDFSEIPVNKRPMAKLLSHNQSSGLSFHNHAQVLKNGDVTFSSILDDIKAAKHSIHLDFYIIEDGNFFRLLKDQFVNKVAEGVKIKLVYDAFGTTIKKVPFINELKEVGVEIKEHMPFSFWTSLSYLNYRNHRKIIVIDGLIAYTGGMNISDKHVSADDKLGLWRDTFVRIIGPAAHDFEKIFKSDWLHAGGKDFDIIKPSQRFEKGVPVQVIASGPDSQFNGILQQYFTLISDAQEYVYISTPYFVPGDSILMALKTAALSGVDIRLMMPYESDYKWMRWCMFTYLEELLASNVKIYLYHGGFLHNKVFISDDIVSSVGTANVDERSFKTNFEVNAIIYDKQTCLDLKAHFHEDALSSEQLSLPEFLHRADRNRFMEGLARLSSPIL